MKNINAGAPLARIIRLAYLAGVPVILIGKHGAGKSASFIQTAKELGLEVIVRDLSLMEPTDLLGIPQVGPDGKTHYAVPAFLPTEGVGFLVFEELNRSARYMQASCMQLLTARALNDYLLPEGWIPCASINPWDDDAYHVDVLDEALMSRFLRVYVKSDVGEWVSWAKKNDIHAAVIKYVRTNPTVFDDAVANPRAWAMASRLLTVWEKDGKERGLIDAALEGVVGEKWGSGFLRSYRDNRMPLEADEILESYPSHRDRVSEWASKRGMDLLDSSFRLLVDSLQNGKSKEKVLKDDKKLAYLRAFYGDLPAELRQIFADELRAQGLKIVWNSKGGQND